MDDIFSQKVSNSNFGLSDKVLEKGDEEDKRWNFVSLSHFLSTISTETKFLMTSIQFLSQKFKADRNPFVLIFALKSRLDNAQKLKNFIQFQIMDKNLNLVRSVLPFS